MSGDGVTRDDVFAALDEVKDPEVPVLSVVELGIVRDVRLDGTGVAVTITPTYAGCPALRVIRGAHRPRSRPGTSGDGVRAGVDDGLAECRGEAKAGAVWHRAPRPSGATVPRAPNARRGRRASVLPILWLARHDSAE